MLHYPVLQNDYKVDNNKNKHMLTCRIVYSEHSK